MHENEAIDFHRYRRLMKLRSQIGASWPYTDRALMALTEVAHAEVERSPWTFPRVFVVAAVCLLLGAFAGLYLGLAAWFVFVPLSMLRIPLELTVLASGALGCGLGCLFGVRVTLRSLLRRQLTQLLREGRCFNCGARPPIDEAGVLTTEPCRQCGNVPAPARKVAAPQLVVAASCHIVQKGVLRDIPQLHHLEAAEASAFVARVTSRRWFQSDYWSLWACVGAVILVVILTIAIVVGYQSGPLTVAQVAVITLGILVGGGLIWVVHAESTSYIRDQVRFALVPRYTCLECGYSFAGLRHDAHGLVRCSECGLLARSAISDEPIGSA